MYGGRKNKKARLADQGNALKEPVGRRIGVARSGVEDIRRRVMAGSWVGLLLAILGFLVIYPLLTLLLGALTDTNPVVEGFSLAHLSPANFLTVLSNPNVAEALANTLIACGGGTLIAVVIGLAYWYARRSRKKTGRSRPRSRFRRRRR